MLDSDILKIEISQETTGTVALKEKSNCTWTEFAAFFASVYMLHYNSCAKNISKKLGSGAVKERELFTSPSTRLGKLTKALLQHRISLRKKSHRLVKFTAAPYYGRTKISTVPC